MAEILALIFAIALEVGIPPAFAQSVAIVESELNPSALNVNYHNDGSISYDRGLFQLNSREYKGEEYFEIEKNIRTGCEHIKMLSQHPKINSYYGLAICYNAGTKWLETGQPPNSSIEYAVKVMQKYNELTNGNIEVVIQGKR